MSYFFAVAGQANFAQEALAGLASKENFSQISLKKTEGTVSTPGGSSAGSDPYKPLMLLHIKGKSLQSWNCGPILWNDKLESLSRKG